MKDYTRLTERDDSLCIDCADIGSCRKTCIMQSRYERLQFLENKIESGELISTVQSEQGEQESAFFTKHNARVRKQAVQEFADWVKVAFHDEVDEFIPSIMAEYFTGSRTRD